MGRKLTNEQRDIVAAGFLTYLNWKADTFTPEQQLLIKSGNKSILAREVKLYMKETLKYRKKKITPPWELVGGESDEV